MKNIFCLLNLIGFCFSVELYPFGLQNGDEKFGFADTIKTLKLQASIPWFTEMKDTLYIGVQGSISASYDTINAPDHDYLPQAFDVLNLYKLRYEYANFRHSIFYRETSDSSVLQKATKDIRLITNDDFNASRVIVVTYVGMTTNNYRTYNNTFQGAIVTDGNSIYVVLAYHSLDEGNAVAGFSKGFYCKIKLFQQMVVSHQLARSTNINDIGRHVYFLGSQKDSVGCNITNILYQHNSPSAMLTNDSSVYMKFKSPVKIGSRYENGVYINENGFVTFATGFPRSEQIPGTYTGNLIYIYNAPMRRIKGGKIMFEEITDSMTLARATDDVRMDQKNVNFTATGVIAITYDGVRDKITDSAENTFQLVIITNGHQSFVLFNYVKLVSTSFYYEFQIVDKLEYCLYYEAVPNTHVPRMASKSNTGALGKYFYELTPDNCVSEAMYRIPVSSQAPLSGVEEINFEISIPLPEIRTKRIWVYGSGYVTSEIKDESLSIDELPYASRVSVYQKQYSDQNSLYALVTTDENFLDRASSDVTLYTKEFFRATQAVFVQYKTSIGETSSIFDSATHNWFQLTLTTNGFKTYAIMNYHRLYGDGVVGYATAQCDWKLYIDPKDSRTLTRTSNIGKPGKHVLELKNDCYKSALYPYDGDTPILSDDFQIILNSNIPMFSNSEVNSLFVNKQGVVSMESNPNPVPNLYLPHSTLSFIAVYAGFYINGSLFYNITNDTTTLLQATGDIRKYNSTTFNAKTVIRITFEDMNDEMDRNTFQLLIVTDYTETFGIFNYGDLDSDNRWNGYTLQNCGYWNITEVSKSREIYWKKMSNIGVPHRFVVPFGLVACGPSTMYPYGVSNGDTELKESSMLNLSKPISFFHVPVSRIFLSTRGFISKEPLQSVSYFTASDVIAMQASANFDLRYGGAVYYRTMTYTTTAERDFIDTVKHDIEKVFPGTFMPHILFLFTFSEIPERQVPGGSTFQMALLSDGIETYAVWNFVKVEARSGFTGLYDEACNKRSTLKIWTLNELLNVKGNSGKKGHHILKLTDYEKCGVTTTTSDAPATTTATTTTKTTTIPSTTTTSTIRTVTTTTTPPTTTSTTPPTTTSTTTKNTTTSKTATTMQVKAGSTTVQPGATDNIKTDKSSSSDSGVIGGATVGGVIFLAIVITIVVVMMKRKSAGNNMEKMSSHRKYSPEVYENKSYEGDRNGKR